MKEKKSIRELIIELIEDGFFITPRTLSEIIDKLSKKGYNYSSTSVFPILQRDFLRKNILKRNGKKKTYKYSISDKI